LSVDPSPPVLLIVEDEPSLLRAFTHAFERSGYVVLAAPDVQGALDLWAEAAPRIALVISDVQMPGRPVEDLIGAISSRASRPPILLMSGELRGTEQRIARLMDSVDGFLPKPLRIEALRAEIERRIGPRPRA
jgi:DNA-binding response OmpR family regulator